VYINEEKTLFGDPNFVFGDLFTGASRHKTTWEKIQLGALKVNIHCSREYFTETLQNNNNENPLPHLH